MNNASPSKHRKLVPALVLAALAIALYSNTISLDYALDDTLILTGNEFTKQGINGIPDILTNDAFTGFFGKQKSLVAGGRYRPLSQVMFAVEYELFGFNPAVGHIINVLLYALLGLVLYLLLQYLFKGEKQGKWWWSLPFIATTLYIAHPLHTEAVANIKGRDEILSMLFAVLAWYASLRYAERPHSGLLVLSGLSFFLALMSKENSITFLAVIPLSLFIFRSLPPVKKLLILMAPLVLATIVFLSLRYNALGFFLGGPVNTELLNNPYINASAMEKFATNLITWGRYLYLLIIPYPLTHDYYPHFFEITGMDNLTAMLVLLLVIGLVVLAFRLWKRKHLLSFSILSFSILYFFITFSIVSNVLFNIGTFMNERFLFMPLLGFSLAVAWLIRQIAAPRLGTKFATGFAAVLILGYSTITIARNPAWADDYTLFTTDIKVSGNSIKCNVSAGGKSLEKYERSKDESERAELLAQAIPWIEKGVRLHPTYLAGWEQMGKAYYYAGDLDRSWISYQNCLRIKPSESARMNLGLVADLALTNKDYPKAVQFLRQMKTIDPEATIHIHRLADAHIAIGQVDSALYEVEQGLAQHPEDYLLLSKAGEIWGRYLQRLDLSEDYLSRSVAANPKYVTSVENLGIVYGMTGRMERSLDLLMQALAIEPDNPRILTNIANTLKSMGREEEANTYFAKASEATAKSGTP